MRSLVKYCFVGLLIIPALACVHGPSRQKVEKDMEINASPDKVWAIISEFCSIQDWHPAVEKCESDGSHEKGTTRVLTLGNGESFTEELLKHEPDNMSYSYRITESNFDAVPVGTYGSTITVKAGDGGGSVVNWRGFFYRAYPNNDPPPELSDEAAVNAVTGIYDAGLAKIKELAE
ncbi:MAG: SRPBCC family protein [Gammaproteobacteria bacterium]